MRWIESASKAAEEGRVKNGRNQYEDMSDRQSQAHSTHQSSFNNWFRNTLRLNRDHEYYLPTRVEMTWYREHIENETQSPGQIVLVRRGNHNTLPHASVQ